MDINVAALKIKAIEEIGKQLAHLRSEATNATNASYSEDCHFRANELLEYMMKFTNEENPQSTNYN